MEMNENESTFMSILCEHQAMLNSVNEEGAHVDDVRVFHVTYEGVGYVVVAGDYWTCWTDQDGRFGVGTDPVCSPLNNGAHDYDMSMLCRVYRVVFRSGALLLENLSVENDDERVVIYAIHERLSEYYKD